MFTPIAVGWLTCEDPGCLGVRLANASVCLAHAANLGLDEFEVELRRISEHGAIDARGVRLSAELLGRLLAAAPHDSHGHVIVRNAQFDRATFDCVAGFNRATFEGETNFGAAVFKHQVEFHGANFKAVARFPDAKFERPAAFEEAAFEGDALFHGMTFESWTSFKRTTFKRTAGFFWGKFKGSAAFEEATFEGDAGFEAGLLRSRLKGGWAGRLSGVGVHMGRVRPIGDHGVAEATCSRRGPQPPLPSSP